MTGILTYWYKKYYLTVLKLCIALLFLDVIIDPSNKIFHLKYILFVAVFLLWLPSLFKRQISLSKELIFFLFFVCLFMPAYALSVGLINSFAQNSSMAEVVYLNSFFFFLLLPIIIIKNIDLTRIFNNSSLVVVVITGISYFILLYKPTTFGFLYDYFVVDKSVAVYALRKYGDYTLLMMFYKTSPLLIFPLAYYLHKLLIIKNRRKLTMSVLALVSIILTLFLSGTRANILSLCLILLFYILFYAYKKSKPLALIVGSIYLLLFFYGASKLAGIFLSSSEVSNTVKLGHLLSYIEHFSNHIGVLIFGQGIGGTIYSTGVHSTVTVTELSYFELVRIWGLPVTLIFGIVLLAPIYKELKKQTVSHLFIAYLAYLFIAGTNPLLLSSTGMLVLVYVFSKTYCSKPSLQ